MIGLHRDGDHWYSWMGLQAVPGITTCMGTMDKPFLVPWAKNEVAACAVRNLEVIVAMTKNTGAQSAIDWLKKIPDYKKDQAADLGTTVHAAAEAMGRGDEILPSVPLEAAPFVATYQRDFLEAMKPEIIDVEYMVYSEQYGYGGTMDVVARIGDEMWLIDYKTGKGIYPETALQLAAGNFADWVGRPDDPQQYPIPKVDRFGVLHIRPEEAKLVEYDVTPRDFETFLALKKAWEWKRERASEIMR